jgi:hypothetical protein
VLPAVAGVLGVDLRTATGLDSTQCARALDLPDAERVVVVLCDGLGRHNLLERAGHAPFLRTSPAQVRELHTSFPATTAVALAVFGTGTAPGRTGILGYTQRNPVTRRLATMVSWTERASVGRTSARDDRRVAAPLRVEPEELQREPTIFEGLLAAGVRATAIGQQKFAESGLTRAALRGPLFITADRVVDRVPAVAASLREPGLTYLYWGELDAAGHRFGPTSTPWGEVLEEFDRELSALVRAVPPGALVLVTSDHGQIEADLDGQIDIALTPSLTEGVDVVAGEPRALHVHVREQPEVVAARWREYLGDRAVVALRSEAIAAGWFGPVAEHVLPWMGDLIVAPAGRLTIVDSRTQAPSALSLRGVHGSLSPAEMTIPFVVFGG